MTRIARLATLVLALAGLALPAHAEPKGPADTKASVWTPEMWGSNRVSERIKTRDDLNACVQTKEFRDALKGHGIKGERADKLIASILAARCWFGKIRAGSLINTSGRNGKKSGWRYLWPEDADDIECEGVDIPIVLECCNPTLAQKPGATGPSGPAGPTGATGATGPSGPTAAPTPTTPPGLTDDGPPWWRKAYKIPVKVVDYLCVPHRWQEFWKSMVCAAIACWPLGCYQSGENGDTPPPVTVEPSKDEGTPGPNGEAR